MSENPLAVKDIDVVCDSCNSVFNLSYEMHMTAGMPVYCPFCGDLCDHYRDDAYIPSENNTSEGDTIWIEEEG